MTRSWRSDGPDGSRVPAPRGTRMPIGLRGSIAGGLSVIGLLAIALVTLTLGSGDLPFSPGSGGPGASGGGGGGARTPTPSNVIVVPPESAGVKVPGTIVYAKDGNIWLQSNGAATQLTTSGKDSMPSFSPDGASVYFVRTRSTHGSWAGSTVLMDVPSLMQVAVTGGTPTTVLDGLYAPPGTQRWMGFIREPVVSPDGKTIAMASDLPNPAASDVTIRLLNVATGKITNPGIPEIAPLGHQDPAWSPDGKTLAFVLNNRDGAKGSPELIAYTVATGKRRNITGPGYIQPSWSPDGKYIAATRTSAFGTDVVILNVATGAEVAQLSNDGNSWAPAWSPAGDEVAFLHVSGQVVDLEMVQLTGTAGVWTVSNPIPLTSNAGLDSISRPDWFVPASQMPIPTPASATPSPVSPAGSGSSAVASPSPS